METSVIEPDGTKSFFINAPRNCRASLPDAPGQSSRRQEGSSGSHVWSYNNEMEEQKIMTLVKIIAIRCWKCMRYQTFQQFNATHENKEIRGSWKESSSAMDKDLYNGSKGSDGTRAYTIESSTSNNPSLASGSDPSSRSSFSSSFLSQALSRPPGTFSTAQSHSSKLPCYISPRESERRPYPFIQREQSNTPILKPIHYPQPGQIYTPEPVHASKSASSALKSLLAPANLNKSYPHSIFQDHETIPSVPTSASAPTPPGQGSERTRRRNEKRRRTQKRKKMERMAEYQNRENRLCPIYFNAQ